MPVVQLAHINLQARQPLLNELRDFYVTVVGLREGPRPAFKVFGYWLYAGADAVVHLAERGIATRPEEPPPVSFSHVALSCVDQAAHELLLTNAGIAFRRTVVPETGTPQIFFQDPAGNGVELIFERRGES